MRKFIAIGVATLCAATFIIGAAPSEASPSDPIVPKVCADLPVKLLRSANDLTAANGSRDAANTDLTNKRAALDAAVVSWITAFANHLVELDKPNGNPAVTKAILDAREGQVIQSVSAWGQAKIAQWQAQHQVDLASIVHLMNTTLKQRLPCPGI